MTRSPLPTLLLTYRRAEEQLVPPDGRFANLSALLMIESIGFNRKFCPYRSLNTTSSEKATTSASPFLRRTEAATSAATSMQRTLEVAVPRLPVTGDCIDPETSTMT